VIDGVDGDPYDALIHARETQIRLVMIEGVARYGVPALMHALHADGEKIRVGGQPRALFLQDADADPDVDAVSLSAATSALVQALHALPELARALEAPKAPHAARLVLDQSRRPVWSLALDEIQDDGVDIRPRLPYAGPGDFTGPRIAAARASSRPLSALLTAMELDPLTVADDPAFMGRIAEEPNVPLAIREGLALLY
jgi:5-methylthioadenosine/S-adenosylhomocysteine deaminase